MWVGVYARSVFWREGGLRSELHHALYVCCPLCFTLWDTVHLQPPSPHTLTHPGTPTCPLPAGIYSLHQVITAITSGAAYAAPYLGRMTDAGKDVSLPWVCPHAQIARTHAHPSLHANASHSSLLRQHIGVLMQHGYAPKGCHLPLILVPPRLQPCTRNLSCGRNTYGDA